MIVSGSGQGWNLLQYKKKTYARCLCSNIVNLDLAQIIFFVYVPHVMNELQNPIINFIFELNTKYTLAVKKSADVWETKFPKHQLNPLFN